MNHACARKPRACCAGLSLVLGALVPAATAQREAEPSPRRVASIADRAGRRISGRLGGDAATGFAFSPGGGGDPIPLSRVTEVTFEGSTVPASEAIPPFHVLLGQGQRLSGRLAALGAEAILLDDGPSQRRVRVARAGAIALSQRPGEAQVFQDGFESLDVGRWSVNGLPEIADEPRLAGRRSLLLPAGGSSITARLAEPVGSGRLELAFADSAARVENHRWFVDLTFREGPNDYASVRAVLGWSEPTLAVESPGGPTLAVQPLARKPGWRRLVVRFDPRHIDLSVDGDELAHGDGPGGPLVEIRLATQTLKGTEAPADLGAHLDDLRLVRLAEPASGLQVDPLQDEVRLVSGDQVFGRVQSADSDHLVLATQGKPYEFGWSEVSGVRFRREPTPSPLLDGLFVRLEWRTGPAGDAQDLDRIEGMLSAVGDDALTVETPYAGALAIPLDRLRRLVILGSARRIVLDPTPHHLGNRFDPHLDPPEPEGGTATLDFALDRLPTGRASLVMDVVQVVGETGNPDFSEEVKAGFLRTRASLNGRAFDDLNRHVRSRNEAPERIRLPIPEGLLRAGPNRLRIDQTGMKSDPGKLDNLGILGMALEFDDAPPVEGPRP